MARPVSASNRASTLSRLVAVRIAAVATATMRSAPAPGAHPTVAPPPPPRRTRAEISHGGDSGGDRARLEPAPGIDVAGQLERRARGGGDGERPGDVESQHRNSGRVRPDVNDGDRRFYGGHLPCASPGGSGKYRQHGLS